MNELTLLVVAFFGIVALLVLLVLTSSKPRREYGVKSVTLKGEEVRSNAERMISDYFRNNNINYVYEQAITGRFLFSKFRISVPDFYLPDYDVYVEYWGLVDADDEWTRAQYVRSMKRKMAIYHRNNIKFISLYPRNLQNLDWIFRRKFKKVTGFELSS
jgi:hypothetical protein